jgi:hypothetical protein
MDVVNDIVNDLTRNSITYNEAQIHGLTMVKDIKHIFFEKSPGRELQKVLKEKQVPWSVNKSLYVRQT